MNNDPLMDVVVDTVLFLEASPSDIVDDDAAVQMLEQIAFTLQQLGPSEKRLLVDYLKRRASRAESESERQSIQSVASNLRFCTG